MMSGRAGGLLEAYYSIEKCIMLYDILYTVRYICYSNTVLVYARRHAAGRPRRGLLVENENARTRAACSGYRRTAVL